MKVTTIRVGKSVEALGQWNKLDIEATVEDETPAQAYQTLKAIVDTLLPGIHSEQPREEEKPELTPEDGLIEIINQCRTIQLLERQRKQVERMNSKRVNEAFENKLKLLQNG